MRQLPQKTYMRQNSEDQLNYAYYTTIKQLNYAYYTTINISAKMFSQVNYPPII